MSKDTLITIVLPVYNGSRYLSESIQSCVNQTYENWELIIVDDASTDDTPEIISSWLERDSRIKAIRNVNNLKLPGSLNAGFALASGDYFTWTSDDNRYLPEALSVMEKYLNQNIAVDVVYSSVWIIDENGKRLREAYAEKENNLLKRNCVGGSFLYRKEIDGSLKGYDKELFLLEDYDFWLRAYAAEFSFSALNDLLYEYREHGGSLTAQKQKQIIDAVFSLKKNIYPKINNLGSAEKAEGMLVSVRHAMKNGYRKNVFIGGLLTLRFSWTYIFKKKLLSCFFFAFLGR